MDKGFQLLEEIIKTSAFRHKVLASNIANVDTPGYKAKDVPFKEEMNQSGHGNDQNQSRSYSRNKKPQRN